MNCSMEIIIKSAGAAIFSSAVCILIKKHNPELSFAISTALTTLIFLASTSLLSCVRELVSCVVDMLGADTTLIRPILKCMGIGYISKFSADICRDASHSALASSLELCGTLCAAAFAMPIVISTLKMIGTMV